jgi:NAD(P)-dependent dehydrogenase (short-subunit alcohol dehydrogenase family)
MTGAGDLSREPKSDAPISFLSGLLAGDVALVTGAGQGNGAAIARGFAASGASVVLADVNADNAKAVSNEINAAGGRSVAFSLDVTDARQCQDIAQKAQSVFGPISIVVNNAGIFRRNALEDEAFLDNVSQQLQVNVEGSLNVARACLPQLRQTKGRIINVASIAAFIAYRSNVTGYAASKGAVVQMTKALACDLSTDGIRVNAIAPGLISTPMTIPSRSQPAIMNDLYQHALIKRFAEPEELVGCALFLASRLSTFVTGVTVPVDGGFIAI